MLNVLSFVSGDRIEVVGDLDGSDDESIDSSASSDDSDDDEKTAAMFSVQSAAKVGAGY